MRLTPKNIPGSKSTSRNGFVLAGLLAALACAGPAGKEGPAGPPGSPPDAGPTPDAGPAALTAETCIICHGSGQLADEIVLHKAAAANALVRSFATITSVTIPSSAPIKPTVVFTVKDAVTNGNPVTGLTSFAFTVAQLVPAATGGISNWRNLINRSYNPLTDVSIGGTTESSLPTAAFPAAAQAACTESPPGTYTCFLGGVVNSCTSPACVGDDLAVVQPLNASYGVVNPVAFNPALPTRVGLQSGAPTPGSPASVTTFSPTIWTGVGGIPPPPAKITVQPTPPFTASFDLHTYDTAVTVTDTDPRSLVTMTACNACHQRLTAHGRRLDVNYCVTCHNSSSLDPSLPTAQRNAPDPYNGTVDFKRVLHKVHMGKNLPSVLAGGTFTFHGVDFSDVAFPQMTSNSTSDPGNCTACHIGATGPAADNWKNKPSRVACASCHDLTSFDATAPAGFTLHSGGPQSDDSACALCHASSSGISPIDQRHTGLTAVQLTLTGKYLYKLISVTNTAPGQKPVVTFQVLNPAASNAPYTLTEPAWAQTANGNSRLAIDIAWTTRAVTTPADTNFNNQGSGVNPGQPVTIDALANKVAGGTAGTFTVTSPTAIPADAVGMGEVVMEGHPAEPVGTPAVQQRIPVKSATLNFAVTGTVTGSTARRQAVDIAKCNVCHGNLTLHGNNRTSSIETCVACHNANATDINRRPTTGTTLDNKAEESIDFKRLIHGIHGAKFSGQGPVIYGFGGTPNDFRKAVFPGNDACTSSNPSFCLVNNCEICHNAGAYSPSFAPANGTTTSTETLADPSTYLRTTKITATCSACHASGLFISHMKQNGGQLDVTQSQIDAAQ